ncbi:hypothetical protein [Hahella sp. HN01]|uniref:hypothetical protein n=1 Tax=Hahella sp. HN01 TaxID=2847262 RepID=UPI001C1E8DE9|nr:hypothetical protein [Hahella sp. HN01]MBU6950855.1 hypothetical protein [Hahella sp. HN01]
MITFKFPEEKEYVSHYARKMNDSRALNILEAGEAGSEDEAEYLSRFFWRMVDKSIEDEEQGEPSLFVESNEFWNEKIMYSISGYLERQGYESIWEKVSDEQ